MLATYFTPSYINDLDRAVWMRQSIRRFGQDACRHIIAVPGRDIGAFAKTFCADKDVELVRQEDAVAGIFYPDRLHGFMSRFAKSQLWRVESHSGRPGWIVQQIVKLNCTKWVDDGAVLFIDSDLIFTRPFHLRDLGIADKKRVLVRMMPADESSKHRAHIVKARELLALQAGTSDHHYMAYPAIWYVDWVKQLQSHLEQLSGTDWQRTLHTAGHISEYTLYGTFVEEVLRPSGLSIRSTPFHRIIFDEKSFVDMQDGGAKIGKADDRLTLVVQSNLGIPVAEYEAILDGIVNRH